VKVNGGWLTGRRAPSDVQGVRSWGADVVLSLVKAGSPMPQEHAIFEAAEKTCDVKEYRHFSVDPIRRGVPTAEQCKQLAKTVLFAQGKVMKGKRVAVQSGQGQERTGVAIYLLLRMDGALPPVVSSRMKTMRPEMHDNGIENKRARTCSQPRKAFFDTLVLCGGWIWKRTFSSGSTSPAAPARLP
jgi:hypothetical protein